MIQKQQSFTLSPYAALYDIIIPKDNELRKMNDLVDFSFVYEELENKYCLDNGRNAIDPICMFKYLLLKSMYNLSDRDLVEHSKYNMAFKYFLGYAPEDDVINATTLTKFRKLRLVDVELLDLLIRKTVEIALEKELIKTKSVILDATHTKAYFNHKTPREALLERSKKLRQSVYKIDENMKSKLPAKNINDNLEDEIKYSQELINAIEKEKGISQYPAVKEKLNYLKEAVEDDVERLQTSMDSDAKIGHKSADTSFFGFKTHIAMTEERIITSAIITSGEKADGKQLQELVKKSIQAGVEVDTVIADAAYSGKDNIQYTNENEIKLVSKLNPSVTQGFRKKEDEFEFNKDAGRYVCKAGHLAIKKARQGRKDVNRNQVDTYYFDVEKCKRCQFKEGCYKEGAKTKTYSVSIKSNIHTEQMEFQESDYFKEKSKERYKIEAKNSELKNQHGYNVAESAGLFGMEIQGATAIFAVNLKRIMKLIDQK